MIAFQVFIQLICSLFRLPPPTTTSALELTPAPAPGLELGTTPASAWPSLETTTIVPITKITGSKKKSVKCYIRTSLLKCLQPQLRQNMQQKKQVNSSSKK
jgi:hypothetical protein